MVKVFIKHNVDSGFKYKRLFKKIVKSIMKLENIEGKTEVSVLITDKEEMSQLYRDYKGIDKTTDVLSFPGGYKELKTLLGYNMFGDIVFDHEKVATQAKLYGHSLKREWAYLFAHGVLHLIGYDHQTKEEEDHMNDLAYKVMSMVKVEKDA